MGIVTRRPIADTADVWYSLCSLVVLYCVSPWWRPACVSNASQTSLGRISNESQMRLEHVSDAFERYLGPELYRSTEDSLNSDLNYEEEDITRLWKINATTRYLLYLQSYKVLTSAIFTNISAYCYSNGVLPQLKFDWMLGITQNKFLASSKEVLFVNRPEGIMCWSLNFYNRKFSTTVFAVVLCTVSHKYLLSVYIRPDPCLCGTSIIRNWKWLFY